MAVPQQNWNDDDLVNYLEIQNATVKSVLDPNTDKDMLEKAESIQMMIRKEYIKFQKACRQVILMNNQVKEISTRYKRVVRDNLRNYCYLCRSDQIYLPCLLNGPFQDQTTITKRKHT